MVTGAFLRVKRSLTPNFLLMIMMLLLIPCDAGEQEQELE